VGKDDSKRREWNWKVNERKMEEWKVNVRGWWSGEG